MNINNLGAVLTLISSFKVIYDDIQIGPDSPPDVLLEVAAR